MFAYMVETQRMMADNLVKLTEVEQEQNDRVAANEERFNILLQEARADRAKSDERYRELKAEIEARHQEQKAESDRKFAEQKAESDRRFAEQKAESDRKFEETKRWYQELIERLDKKNS